MFPHPVVPCFDIAENFTPGLFLACKYTMRIDQLPFERRKKALCHRVIPAISFTTHTTPHPGFLQRLLEKIAGILDSPIGVMNKAGFWFSSLYSHTESFQYQMGLHIRFH